MHKAKKYISSVTITKSNEESSDLKKAVVIGLPAHLHF